MRLWTLTPFIRNAPPNRPESQPQKNGHGVHPGALSLFRIRQIPADEPAAPRPENQRVWASLLKGKTAVIEEVAHEMQRRDPQGIKTRVALTDGERALQILVEGRSASP